MRPAISSSALCLAFVIALAIGCGDATPRQTTSRTALHVSESGEISLVREGVTLAVLLTVKVFVLICARYMPFVAFQHIFSSRYVPFSI